MNERPLTSEDIWERYEERRTTETVVKKDPILEQSVQELHRIAQELHQININLEKIANKHYDSGVI